MANQVDDDLLHAMDVNGLPECDTNSAAGLIFGAFAPRNRTASLRAIATLAMQAQRKLRRD
jgi:hypothetical protein